MQCEMTYQRDSINHARGARCVAESVIRYSIGGALMNVCGYHARQIARAMDETRNIVKVSAVALAGAGAGCAVKLTTIAASDGALAVTPAEEA